MKADAQSPAEKEALQWAVEFFRDRANGLKENRRVLKVVTEEQFLLAHQESLEGYLGYIEDVLRQEQNILAVCRAAAPLIESGQPLSKPLLDFVAAFLRDPKK